MPMIDRSFKVRPEVWRTLVMNAVQSGVPIRDFLAFLIARSNPVPEGQTPERKELEEMLEANRRAGTPPTGVASQCQCRGHTPSPDAARSRSIEPE